MITSTAGSLVIMKLCMEVEKLGAAAFDAQGAAAALGKTVQRSNKIVAWIGVQSLIVLCAHRVESAVFNWQKIMETFAPNVWSWPVAYQGLYMFALRFALVLALSALVLACARAIRALWGRRQSGLHKSRKTNGKSSRVTTA